MEDQHPSSNAAPVVIDDPGPARRGRVAMFRPLRIRDFALLWTGMSVSLLGDGIYYVALPWQVLELSNAATALSLVGVAWTLPMVAFLLVGGVVSDRFDRRRVMIMSDVIRLLAIGSIGALSLGGGLELWHVMVFVAFYGVGDALFNPAFGAIVPDVVPTDMLVEANSLDHFIKPFALRLAGPAIGGFAVHWLEPGGALLLDAATFAASALAVLLMRPRPHDRSWDGRGAFSNLADGFRFVRSQVWLWGTLIAAAIALLTFFGPFQVLVPLVVKTQLGGSAQDLGWVYALGGAGGIIGAIAVGQRGLPRKHVLFMYLCWVGSALGISGFGLAQNVGQMMLASFLMAGLNTASMVVWGTLMHRLVPSHMMGRVHSFDWLVSTALVPVSFALTGPVAAAIGADATLIAAGLMGSVSTLLFLLFLKGLRDTERDGSVHADQGAGALSTTAVVDGEPTA